MQLLKYFSIILLHIVIHHQCIPLFQESQASINPEENPGIYQGDMLLQPNDDTPTGKGVAIRPAYQRWVGGIIPYEFASNITANNTAFIVQQMRVMENLTMVGNTQCIRFREKNATDPFFITIFNGSGCYAPVGSWGNLVRVRGVSLMHGLYSTCIVSGIVQHELMHVLGFFHEQSRPDRDSYVSIQWANIDPWVMDAFEKYNESMVDTLMTSYDYGSVMHYERDAFAINRSAPTIIPTQNATAYIGQRIRLSPVDILEIQRYYGCVPTPTITTTTTTSTVTSTSTRTTSITTVSTTTETTTTSATTTSVTTRTTTTTSTTTTSVTTKTTTTSFTTTSVTTRTTTTTSTTTTSVTTKTTTTSYTTTSVTTGTTTTTSATTTSVTTGTTITSATTISVTTGTTTNAIAIGTTTMTTTGEPKNAAAGSIVFTPVQLFLVVLISTAYHLKQCHL